MSHFFPGRTFAFNIRQKKFSPSSAVRPAGGATAAEANGTERVLTCSGVTRSDQLLFSCRLTSWEQEKLKVHQTVRQEMDPAASRHKPETVSGSVLKLVSFPDFILVKSLNIRFSPMEQKQERKVQKFSDFYIVFDVKCWKIKLLLNLRCRQTSFSVSDQRSK